MAAIGRPLARREEQEGAWTKGPRGQRAREGQIVVDASIASTFQNHALLLTPN
jgi:hypothetical protein